MENAYQCCRIFTIFSSWSDLQEEILLNGSQHLNGFRRGGARQFSIQGETASVPLGNDDLTFQHVDAHLE